jgi:hypothetical protein
MKSTAIEIRIQASTLRLYAKVSLPLLKGRAGEAGRGLRPQLYVQRSRFTSLGKPAKERDCRT